MPTHVDLDTRLRVGGLGDSTAGGAPGLRRRRMGGIAAWFTLFGFRVAGAARFLRQPATWRAIGAGVDG